MKTEVVLRAYAQRRPDHEALVCGERRVTYAALSREVNQAAHAFASLGVTAGDRVALLLGNGIAWVEVALGAIALGALVVPVSTRLAAPEVRFILEDATPALLVADAAYGATAEAAARAICRVVTTADVETLAARQSTDPPPVAPPFPDDCMIGYTSGTTGTPKGAVTTHANLLLVALLNNLDFGLTGDDRLLVTTPFAHRTALARLWNALTLGATLVIMPRFDAAETLATIERERITVTGVVPTVARMLLDAIDAERAGRYASVRTMIAVGEAFPVRLKERLFAMLPGIRLFSALGMTEAFGAGVLHSEDQLERAASVGRPVPGVEVRLLGDDGREVPTGEVGEIAIRCGEPGRWLTMRGYWNRPVETAEALRDGWMRSGDLGRFDADGFLYVVDRKKDMILSGGLNIYSKEVERAILDHPAVADAAVVGTADAAFGEAVVAYVELCPGASATADEIREHCRTHIASYKKPKYVEFMALPRNGQGKVLKGELRELAAGLGEVSAAG